MDIELLNIQDAYAKMMAPKKTITESTRMRSRRVVEESNDWPYTGITGTIKIDKLTETKRKICSLEDIDGSKNLDELPVVSTRSITVNKTFRTLDEFEQFAKDKFSCTNDDDGIDIGGSKVSMAKFVDEKTGEIYNTLMQAEEAVEDQVNSGKSCRFAMYEYTGTYTEVPSSGRIGEATSSDDAATIKDKLIYAIDTEKVTTVKQLISQVSDAKVLGKALVRAAERGNPNVIKLLMAKVDNKSKYAAEAYKRAKQLNFKYAEEVLRPYVGVTESESTVEMMEKMGENELYPIINNAIDTGDLDTAKAAGTALSKLNCDKTTMELYSKRAAALGHTEIAKVFAEFSSGKCVKESTPVVSTGMTLVDRINKCCPATQMSESTKRISNYAKIINESIRLKQMK